MPRVRERLADQLRADQLALQRDEAARRLVRECELGDGRDERRVGESEQGGHHDQQAERGTKQANEHGALLRPNRLR